MADHSPDIFDTEDEEGSLNNEHVKEEPEEEPEEEQEEAEENGSSSEEEDDNEDYDPWNLLRRKVGNDLKDYFVKEVKRFLDKGKTQEYADHAAFNSLLPVSRRRLRKTYLQRLLWIHRIKRDTIHRKVVKTLERFMDEDDMDYEEAAESAVEKRKFLINRVLEKKLLPDELEEEPDGEDERAEEGETSVN